MSSREDYLKIRWADDLYLDPDLSGDRAKIVLQPYPSHFVDFGYKDKIKTLTSIISDIF